MTAPLTKNNSADARGFTILELMIVIAMISVITGFALIQVVQARQDMTRANALQLFAAHLEKARVDSVRRRPADTTEMAQVSIINASFYSVTIDSDGSGGLDAPKVISLPENSNLEFNVPYPRTIYFNWRGRTVDADGNAATPDFVTISNAYGESRIDLSSSGQPSLEGPPPNPTVTNSTAPAAEFRDDTQVHP
jgi:prepilin-type N-terminal cleavage/methylation domain-containing protein